MLKHKVIILVGSRGKALLENARLDSNYLDYRISICIQYAGCIHRRCLCDPFVEILSSSSNRENQSSDANAAIASEYLQHNIASIPDLHEHDSRIAGRWDFPRMSLIRRQSLPSLLS